MGSQVNQHALKQVGPIELFENIAFPMLGIRKTVASDSEAAAFLSTLAEDISHDEFEKRLKQVIEGGDTECRLAKYQPSTGELKSYRTSQIRLSKLLTLTFAGEALAVLAAFSDKPLNSLELASALLLFFVTLLDSAKRDFSPPEAAVMYVVHTGKEHLDRNQLLAAVNDTLSKYSKPTIDAAECDRCIDTLIREQFLQRIAGRLWVKETIVVFSWW